MIEVGDVVPIQLTVKNDAGAPADSGGMTLSITLPNLAGTVLASPADFTILRPTGPGTGVYRYDFPTTLEGPHAFVWVGTGANATTHRDMFNVEERITPLVSTDEALAHLRAQEAISLYPDVEYLRWLVRLSSRSVEDDLGRVLGRRSITEVYDGGQAAVVLRRKPVLQVTSVSDAGTALAGTDYTLDASSGILYRGGQYSPRSFRNGLGSVAVVYEAGYLIPPMITRQVCLRNVQRLWQQSNQMPHPALDDLDAEARLFTPAGVLTPVEMKSYERLRIRRGLA